jgi:hypothetical protein
MIINNYHNNHIYKLYIKEIHYVMDVLIDVLRTRELVFANSINPQSSYRVNNCFSCRNQDCQDCDSKDPRIENKLQIAQRIHTRRSAWQKLDRYWSGGMISVVPVDELLLRRANRIIARCYPEVALRSLDAIHLASREAADAFPLIANDRQMRMAAELLHFPLGPLPAAI